MKWICVDDLGVYYIKWHTKQNKRKDSSGGLNISSIGRANSGVSLIS